MTRMPTYFISHGGGPWPWMPDWRAMFKNLEASFVQMVKDLPERPKAILMISGHWEDDSFAVMSSAHPPMVYDYHGFPPETFQIQYKAPGAPDLAQRAHDLIKAAGLPVRLDPKQGYDHGTFVPAYIMYPDADVPLFQISLRKGYSPADHFALVAGNPAKLKGWVGRSGRRLQSDPESGDYLCVDTGDRFTEIDGLLVPRG